MFPSIKSWPGSLHISALSLPDLLWNFSFFGRNRYEQVCIKIWNGNYSDLEVDFGHEENASIVYAALAVDKEVIVWRHEIFIALPIVSQQVSDSVTCLLQLQPDKVKRLMTVSNGKLSVWVSSVVSMLLFRVSFSQWLYLYDVMSSAPFLFN